MICFELNRCEVTWPFGTSFTDLYKQTQALLLSPVLFVFGLQWVAHYTWLALQSIIWAMSLCVSLLL